MRKPHCCCRSLPARLGTVIVALLLLLAAAVSAAPEDETLIFHLPLDGSLNPKVAKGENTFRGLGEIKYTEGVKGQALVVGGKSRAVYPADGNLSMVKGTCSLWVKPIDWIPSDPTFQFFVAFQSTHTKKATRIILYKIHENENLGLLFESGSAERAVSLQKSVTTWQKGQWHHLAFTWDKEAEIRLYVDGKQVAKRKCFAFPEEGWQLFLGIPWPHWGKLGERKTAVDELTIHSRVFSDEEIGAVYKKMVEESQAPGLANAAMKTKQRPGNLAVPQCGAFVLTSSFRSTTTFHPDNLIDQDPDTVWRAWDGDFPQWIELRWTYPMRVNEIVLQEVAPATITAYSVHVWRNNTWEFLERSRDRPVTAGGEVSCTFSEVTAERFRITIEGGTGKYAQLSALQAFGPPQTLISTLEPYWKSWYIWYPEPDRMHKGNAPRYFRKSFTIENFASVKSAYLQARSNDYYKIYLNGQEVATGSKEIWPIQATDYLRQGKNTIAIVADLTRDPGRWGWGELITELALNHETHNVYIGTDETWKSHNLLVKGWEQIEFDDSAWLKSAPYVQPPAGPWGKIPYYPTACREKVIFNRITATPVSAQPGGNVRLDISLTPPQQLKNDYIFLLELKGKEVMRANCNFKLSAVIAEPRPPTSQWPANQPTILSVDVNLPAWSPHGEMPVHLRALDKKRGVSIDILDNDKQPVTQAGAVRIARFAKETSFEPLPKCRIVRKNNSPVFALGDKIATPITWMLHNPSFETYHEYSKADINIFWLGELLAIDGSAANKQRANDHLDVQIRDLLAVNPDARIFITLELRPAQAWLKEHPDERMIDSLGGLGPVSLASAKYHELIDGHLRATLDFINAQPYAGRIIGYRPMSFGRADSGLGGRDGNTWQTDRSKVLMGDYNPQATKLFQTYLRRKYDNSVTALQKAWKDDAVTFDTATPVPAELTHAPADGGVFIDPTLGISTKKYDYCGFLSTLIPNNYFRIAKIIKDATDGKALVGIHYGYMVEYMRGIHPPGPQGDDNFYPDNMLDNPLIDFYCGAVQYGSRRAGRSFQSMFAHASIGLHNKLYINDGDYRTVIASPITYGRQYSMKETVAVFQRDLASTICQGFGCWHSDMGKGDGRAGIGWFNHPEICGAIAKMNEICKTGLSRERVRTAEVAVFISGHTWYYHDVYNAQNIYNNLVMRVIYNEMPRIGAPFDVYQMNDLKDDTIQKKYKLYVFINPYYMSAEEAQSVERLKRGGKTLFWFYAPGYVNRATGLVAGNISNTTGIIIKKKPEPREEMQYSVTNTNHLVTQEMDPKSVLKAAGFGYPLAQKMHPTAFGPVFYADDPKAVALAAYPDGRTAVAAKDMGAWKSVYCAMPYADKHLIRGVARYAGVHLYCPVDVVMDADNRLVMVHNGFEGVKNIVVRLPQKQTVYDAWTGESVGRDTDRIAVKLEDCRTRLFRLE